MLSNPLQPKAIIAAMKVADEVIPKIISTDGPHGLLPRQPDQVALILDLIVTAAAAHEQSCNLRQQKEVPQIFVSVIDLGGDKK